MGAKMSLNTYRSKPMSVMTFAKATVLNYTKSDKTWSNQLHSESIVCNKVDGILFYKTIVRNDPSTLVVEKCLWTAYAAVTLSMDQNANKCWFELVE